jgi:hypothetical protein
VGIPAAGRALQDLVPLQGFTRQVMVVRVNQVTGPAAGVPASQAALCHNRGFVVVNDGPVFASPPSVGPCSPDVKEALSRLTRASLTWQAGLRRGTGRRSSGRVAGIRFRWGCPG